MKIVENALVIYTDGSLYPKGRKGGYGIVFLYFDDVGEEHFITSHEPIGIAGTTGNRMELEHEGQIEVYEHVGEGHDTPVMAIRIIDHDPSPDSPFRDLRKLMLQGDEKDGNES